MSLRKLLMSGGSQAAMLSATFELKMPELPTPAETSASVNRAVNALVVGGPVTVTRRTITGAS